MSDEEDLNMKRLMEQSVPFHEQDNLIRDIYRQWSEGKILTDRQERAFISTLHQRQRLVLRYNSADECGKHNLIYVVVRILSATPVFTGQDEIQYSLRRGNVKRLPLADVVTLVMRRYADFHISTALELSEHHITSPPDTLGESV